MVGLGRLFALVKNSHIGIFQSIQAECYSKTDPTYIKIFSPGIFTPKPIHQRNHPTPQQKRYPSTQF
jgi:hypothetical protein